MSDFQSQAGPFQIKVIEGWLSQSQLQTGQQPGVIKLGGRSGPFRPLKIGGKMRVQTTFYPGNPVATQQPIGATEDPTTITGEWNDRFLGDGAAFQLMEQVDQIRKSGLSVEVSWGGSIGGTTDAPQLGDNVIVRVGIISSTAFTIQRVQDVEWEIVFDWRSSGQASTPMVASTSQLNPREGFADVNAELDAAIALWEATMNGPQLAVGLPQQALDAINQAFDRTATVVDAIEQASATITSAVVIPAAAAQQLIGACASGIEAMTTAAQTVLGLNRLLIEVRDSATDTLRLADQLFDVLNQTDVASGACVDAKAGIEINIEADVIAQVRAPAGTDLRDLALQFYGDADGWWAIANANGIDGSAVPPAPAGASDDPARPIIIPRLHSGTSSDLRQQC